MPTNKSLGQHWLKNRSILDAIAALAATPGVDFCIEIGPGLGTLTSSLFKHFAAVCAIEFDANLAAKLPGSFPGKNLQVLQADILQTDLAALAGTRPYVVAGNIPYYITSPIIRQLLESPALPAKIVLLIQKEVAERLLAGLGDYSFFALYVQNLAAVERGPLVPAAEFTPPPKVDSEVIVLTPRPRPLVSPAAIALAKKGFANPRKKLSANLAAATRHSKTEWEQLLADNFIEPTARAEDLDHAMWQLLATLV